MQKNYKCVSIVQESLVLRHYLFLVVVEYHLSKALNVVNSRILRNEVMCIANLNPVFVAAEEQKKENRGAIICISLSLSIPLCK